MVPYADVAREVRKQVRVYSQDVLDCPCFRAAWRANSVSQPNRIDRAQRINPCPPERDLRNR